MGVRTLLRMAVSAVDSGGILMYMDRLETALDGELNSARIGWKLPT